MSSLEGSVSDEITRLYERIQAIYDAADDEVAARMDQADLWLNDKFRGKSIRDSYMECPSCTEKIVADFEALFSK